MRRRLLKLIAAASHRFFRVKIIRRRRFLQARSGRTAASVSGKMIEVLFNYAPQGEEHFLLIPKEHRTGFKELQEGSLWRRWSGQPKLPITMSSRAIPVICIINRRARRTTVPHWHLHIVVVKPEKGAWEKLKVIWRIYFCGAHPFLSANFPKSM